MLHLRLPDELTWPAVHRRLPFFLAMEEWTARNLPAGDYFFSWQVDPTVICGRNQDIVREVDLDYCHSAGIDVVRRRSGGGAVFADRDNFMFSYITASENVTEVFAAYTAMIAGILRSLGLDAEASGRNDITIEGRKVSGNAFYHLPGRSIAHGTMLYDFNPEYLSKALTPSRAKLESKGVKSVPMRVTSLRKEGLKLPPREFEKYTISRLTDSEYVLSHDDVRAIEGIEAEYYRPSFLRIRTDHESGSDVRKHTIIPGSGEFCLEYNQDSSGRISSVTISGDFFMNDDVATKLCHRLEGTSLHGTELEELIKTLSPGDIIPGLDAETLIRLIRD